MRHILSFDIAKGKSVYCFIDELRNVIANQFACEYKTYDFGEICNAFIDDLIRLMENSIKNEQGNF